MNPEPLGPSPRRHRWFGVDCTAIILVNVGLYLLLMLRYPIIYGGDTIARLVDPARIINGHQLPLLQVLLYLALRIHDGPLSVFLLMALVSGAAGAGMYALAGIFIGNRCASLTTAVLYSTHPFILYYSRVPYQEPLLVAGVTWGFYHLYRSYAPLDRVWASLCFGIACFTRYEGWIAALIAAAYDFWRGRNAERRKGVVTGACTSALLFGWAPAVWIFWNADLSPTGSYVLDLRFRWGRLYRPYFISKSVLWWTESSVVLAAAIGFFRSWLEPALRRDRRLHMLFTLIALFMIVLLFSGHGIEPDSTRIVTEREAFLPVTLLVLSAGLGVNWMLVYLGRTLPFGKWQYATASILLLSILAGFSLNRGLHRVAAANEDPDLKTDYQVAQFLASRHAGGLVLAAPFPPELTANYLANVERWSGVKGRMTAEKLLREAETTPIDYQRVLTYSWLGKQKVFSGEQLNGLNAAGIEQFIENKAISYLVVFSDFVPTAEHERMVLAAARRRQESGMEIRNGNKIARIYSLQTVPD